MRVLAVANPASHVYCLGFPVPPIDCRSSSKGAPPILIFPREQGAILDSGNEITHGRG